MSVQKSRGERVLFVKEEEMATFGSTFESVSFLRNGWSFLVVGAQVDRQFIHSYGSFPSRL